jgi:hypothetical protein
VLNVIIPCRNEPTERVLDTVRQIRKYASEPRIITVNDDGEPHGFGLAVRRGLARCEEGYVVIMMADLSDDPQVLWKMQLMLNNGYDLVCGSRYMKGGRQIGGPLIKRTLSRWCGKLLYFAGVDTHDATNAYKMLKVSRLHELDLKSDGFALNLEITAKAHRLGWQIGEVPVAWRDRKGGRSKFRLTKELGNYLYWFVYAVGAEKKSV